MKIDLSKIFSAINSFVSKHYRWFVGAEIIAIVFAGWLFLLKGEWNTIKETGILEYESTNQSLQDKGTHLMKLRLMEKEFEKINQERLQQLQAVLPSSYSPTALITTMQSFADQAGIEIISVDVVEQVATTSTTARTTEADQSATGSSIGHPNIRTLTITVNIKKEKGTYSELKLFLDTLESFVPVLDMKNLSFSPDTSNIALQLQTYYYDSSVGL